MTGEELNTATQTYKYSSFSNYALIWFREAQVAILKINRVIFSSGSKFTNDEFKQLFEFFDECDADQANSETPRKWKLKAKKYLEWIDPRADE